MPLPAEPASLRHCSGNVTLQSRPFAKELFMMLFALVLAAMLTATVAYAQSETFKKDIKQRIASGDDVKEVDATVTIAEDRIVVARKGAETVIPFTAITSMSYDRR